MNINVAILGASGYGGNELIKILANHPKVKIKYAQSRSSEGKMINEIYSDSNLEIKYSNPSVEQINSCDAVFLALPKEEAASIATKIKTVIIDLSPAHRFDSKYVYGLPEINKEKIKKSNFIANPGCYATSILLGLLPLKGKVSNVCIASTSGVSGAGLDVKDIDNFLIYKEGRQHQQIREIEDILDINDILFVPQRIDSTEKGIISTIFAKPKIKEDLNSLYKEFYKQEQFIRIKDSIETKDVIGTNYCDIKILEIENKIIIISALDNLIKGGSGQAVQNFNIMHGFDESVGLI